MNRRAKPNVKRNQPRIRTKQRSYLDPEMYTSISIRGFRGISHLELRDLGQINLFFGANNVGKTSILEAIYTHACGLNFTPLQGRLLARRGESVSGALDYGDRIISLFNNVKKLPYNFTITGRLQDDDTDYVVKSTFHPSAALSDLDPRLIGQSQGILSSDNQTEAQNTLERNSPLPPSLRLSPLRTTSSFLGTWEIQLNGVKTDHNIRFPPSDIITRPPFKLGIMHDILAHRQPETEIRVFSMLKRYGILEHFSEEMHASFPDIKSIDMIPYPDGTTGPIYAKTHDDRQLPLYVFGDGIRRWFYLLGHMFVYKPACHCIEEVDVAFHTAAYGNLSRLLVEYSTELRNQLFLTSHSIEFADEFLRALYGDNGRIGIDDDDPVRIFTLQRPDPTSDLVVWSLSGREAYEKRIHYDLELR